MALALVCQGAAAASELSEGEVARLYAGTAVVREETIERAGRRYVGGTAYILIDAPPEQVLATIDDVKSYAALLPATRHARWLGMSRNGESIVQLEQGTAVVHGSYVIRTRVENRPDGAPTLLRFWLDPRFPHDVADANGYFRAEPLNNGTLLTYGVWVDLGPGLLSRLLETKVRKGALSTPARVKRFIEARRPFG